MARWKLRILVASSVAIAAGTLCLDACSATPPLASDLPANIAEAGREFDHRIQQRFPIGSSEADLIRELSRQGFAPSVHRGDSPATHVYSFDKGSFPCDLVWNIIWKADGAGSVTTINGVHYASCL
jgi:hypothetical protein